MNVVHADSIEAQRWRNGAGLTRELLAWPDARDWQLRISVADIRDDAPFSAYPGVDRWFAVISGAGVLLRDRSGRHEIGPASAPHCFHGEAAPDCALIDGPTRDLNLMWQRAHGRATMQRALPGAEFVSHDPFRALFAADDVWLQVDGADALHLPPFSLAWGRGALGAWRLRSDSAQPRAWWLSHRPAIGA
jgi:environmental stress-induced protein Ves